MPEQNTKNIRVPVKGEESKHTNHKIRTIVVSQSKGTKALYCISCKKIITYLFVKAKDWTMATAEEWAVEHSKTIKSLEEVHVDQMDEFMKLLVTKQDNSTEEYLPNSPSFIMNKDNEEETMGYSEEDLKARGEGQGQGGQRQGDGGASKCVCSKCGAEIVHKKGVSCSKQKCPKCGNVMVGKALEEDESVESIDVVKVDKTKQIVYGVFLVPEKADHDGDVISSDDIEKVAHGFLVDYRTVDEMHKNIIAAEIVESSIAWKDDLDYQGKKLSKGTWFGAIKINDRDVWEKVVSGDYKAFSVRIAGIREPIKEES